MQFDVAQPPIEPNLANPFAKFNHLLNSPGRGLSQNQFADERLSNNINLTEFIIFIR